jgi:thiol-disulfide isomerase/thioredoxin
MKPFVIILFLCLSLKGNSQVKTDSLFFNTFIKIQKQLSDKYIGLKYPHFDIKLSDSQSFSNTDLENKVVFINFWAKHCKPCIEETEGLNQLYSKLINYPDFRFVSFSYDPDSTINSLINSLNIKFKVYHLDRNEYLRLNLNNGIPTSIILDRNGVIQYFVCGSPGPKENATKFIMTYTYPRILQLIGSKQN